MKRGFTLLELTMVLLIGGLMVGLGLKFNQSSGTQECYASTQTQIQTIRESVERFARNSDRLPLPAARNIGVDHASFGREATPAEILAGALDVAGGVSFGAVPFQALGLAPSFAGDCWGNKFSYAVTTALTTNASPGGYLDASTNGNITLRSDVSNSINTSTAYAIISHGEDALGAVKTNYAGVGHGWCTGALALSTLNCRASSAEIVSGAFNNGKDAAANYFDDIVVASGRPQIIAAAPPPPPPVVPINGVCNYSCYVALYCNPTSSCEISGCSSGTVAGFVASGNDGTWECEGIDGGITATCSLTDVGAETCGLPPAI